MSDAIHPVSQPSAEIQGEVATRVGNGPPLFVSADCDLAAKPGSHLDSWFLIANLESTRGTMYVLVHYLHVSPQGGAPDLVAAMVSLLDPKTNRYLAEEQDFPGQVCSFDPEKFAVVTPIASASGTTDAMNFKGSWPAAGVAVDLTASQTGPMLPNMGAGLFPVLKGMTYHYALPTMSAAGTVTLDGTAYEVKGAAWLDRQWGVAPGFFTKGAKKWVWFGIMLENGERLSVWEFAEADRPVRSWATVVRPSGGVDVVACEPMAARATKPWKSPQTGHVYPIRWSVTIPQLDADFTIEPDVVEQEFVSPAGMHKYEGFSPVVGTWRGQPASGRVVIEMVGDWH